MLKPFHSAEMDSLCSRGGAKGNANQR